MATSTLPSENPKKQLDDIRFSEKVLFWAERVQIFELILFPIIGHVFPAFVPNLWMYIAIGINMFYVSTFIERQNIRPFSFEPDCGFYLERIGFLFVFLNSLGYMEKGLDYSIDILGTTQLFLILEFLVTMFRSLKKKLDEPENAKIKALVDNVISNCSGWIVYAISLIINYLALIWESLFLTPESKAEGENKNEKEAEKLIDLESNEDESNSLEENMDEVTAAVEVNEEEAERKPNEHYEAVLVEFEAQRQLWEKEKSNLLQKIKHLEVKLRYFRSPPMCVRVPHNQWDDQKATLANKIQNYETEKQVLLEKHNKLVQEKCTVEVELRVQKSLSEQYKGDMLEFKRNNVEQSEKNIDLAGKLSAEFWMVKKLSSENDELKAKCRELEEERCNLIAELVLARTAYEYYFSNSTNSRPQ